jgi:hypothetical protein
VIGILYMSNATSPKNQNLTLTAVAAPPGAVTVRAPRKPRPGFKRIVIGWRPVPLHADLVDDVELAEHRARGDEKWRPRHGTRCGTCFLKEPKPGHFCRWATKNGPGAPSPKRIVYKPLFQWVPV